YILFVGTIEPRKNIPGLVRAYEILKSQRPDVPHLVLGGQRGWHADEALSAIQNSSARASIHWIDDVPFEALPALYCGATVFVLPSFHEGFGMPAIEAMACGTPVVVSARGSLPEVVGSYGVFVEPDQPDSITSGIERLLDDSALYQQLTQDGLSHARGYSWGRTARIALGVYRQILGLQT
ncbi:MAG: glycosyltransferase family 4 protein, partial [Chloroflexi bacterium]|nr:glycosyltransferase family 4 protein [Chloroflexota bacterium]